MSTEMEMYVILNALIASLSDVRARQFVRLCAQHAALVGGWKGEIAVSIAISGACCPGTMLPYWADTAAGLARASGQSIEEQITLLKRLV